MKSKTVAILGTLDTKGEEFGFLRSRIESAGLTTLVIDCGVLEAPVATPDISREEVARAGGQEIESLLATRDRGISVGVMAAGARYHAPSAILLGFGVVLAGWLKGASRIAG